MRRGVPFPHLFQVFPSVQAWVYVHQAHYGLTFTFSSGGTGAVESGAHSLTRCLTKNSFIIQICWGEEELNESFSDKLARNYLILCMSFSVWQLAGTKFCLPLSTTDNHPSVPGTEGLPVLYKFPFQNWKSPTLTRTVGQSPCLPAASHFFFFRFHHWSPFLVSAYRPQTVQSMVRRTKECRN